VQLLVCHHNKQDQQQQAQGGLASQQHLLLQLYLVATSAAGVSDAAEAAMPLQLLAAAGKRGSMHPLAAVLSLVAVVSV
jgi:hypothetical protein